MSSSSDNLITIEKSAKKLLLNKYSSRDPSSLKYQYIGLIMENLIFNKNTHEVTMFKDYMIWDYYDEFFKRFYSKKESRQRVPKFSSFYKNYLKFFCIPTLKDTFPNEVVHACSEKKAELFYNENYKRKKRDNSELKDCGLYQDSESDLSESRGETNLSKKIFFNESARKKIEKNSPINTSIVLNESETKLKDDESGLLITASELDSVNENSLRDIMTNMKKKNKLNPNSQKLILYANDYISSKTLNKPKNQNSRNKSLDIILNNNKNNNKNKQLTTYNSVKKEKRETLSNSNNIINNKNIIKNKINKKEEQIKTNNFLLNINNSNQLIKKNHNNNSKIITSLNNNNNNYYNYNGSRNLSQNPQKSSTITNNTYSRNNNLDKINNIKKTINLNLIKSKNIQTLFGKYNAHPSIYINQQNEKKSKNINKNVNNKENMANSAKSIFIKNNINNNNIKMTSYKYFIKNSSFSQVKLPKTNNNNNTIQTNKKTARILSYKDYQKSENEKNKKNKNIINTKLTFEGILHNNHLNKNNHINSNNTNNIINNNNKRYNIINYNGEKHIHNINININNHINIGPKQFQDIFTFSDLVKIQNKNNAKNNNKKNNLYAFLKTNNKNTNYISRNKHQSLDFNSLINNTNSTNNANKMNSMTDIHNSVNKNSIYRTQYLVNNGKNGNIYNFKNKKSSKIKLLNDNNNILMALKNKI